MSSIRCGVILFAAYFNVLVIVGSSICPSNDWYHVNCSCFIVKSSKKDLNWNKAMEQCSGMGKATLASIKSQNQNRILGHNLYMSKKESWIGLRSEGNSSLLWPNGEEPKFLSGIESRYDETRCIASRLTNIWEAGNCEERHRYICSRKLVGAKGCPPGWQSHLKSCYKLSTDLLPYTKAKENCIRMNSTLVEISTKQEYEFLRKQLKRDEIIIQVWFGLQKAANATSYQYSDGSTPNHLDLGVSFRSKTKRSEAYCVSMELAKTNVTWEAKECSAKLMSYVCETRITGLDFKINVTNVNETSANISWSSQPHQCLSSSGKKYKLEIYEESKLKNSITIIKPQSYQIAGGFKPKTKYQIKILENDKRITVTNFSTSKIENPLRVLTMVSSRKIHAKEGDTVNLLCAVTGEPPIKFSWEKDMNKLKSYVETENPRRSSILSVQLNNQTRFGKYFCHIQDQFGNKTHEIQVIPLSKDDSEDNDWFVIAIVILGIAVVTLLVIIAYFIRSIRHLRRRLKEAKQANPVTLKNVSKEGLTFDKPESSPGKTSTDGRYIRPEDENEQYTALKRNGEEEENFYSPLKEAPLYVNAGEFK